MSDLTVQKIALENASKNFLLELAKIKKSLDDKEIDINDSDWYNRFLDISSGMQISMQNPVMKAELDNHYKWLDRNFPTFLGRLGLDPALAIGMEVAHGDKCYQYKDEWIEAGVPWYHGTALYLLSYIDPYDKDSRQTDAGWVPVEEWVIDFYPKVKSLMDDLL